MEPLYNQKGQVYVWFNEELGHIISLSGQHLAFLNDDNVYNWQGAHIGWWENGHMRDSKGAVVVFSQDATNLIVAIPGRAGMPGRPGIAGVPGRPGLAGRPGRPGNLGSWATEMPF